MTEGTITKFSAGANVDSTNQGIKELVRLLYNLTSSTADSTAMVHQRLLTPSWLTS